MTRAALALFAAALALTLLPGPWGDERVSDLFLYRSYAAAFLDGALPFRDLAFEYPPLAAPLIALPGVASTGEEGYRLAFAALALGLGAAVVLLAGALAERTGGDRRAAMLAAAGAPLLTGAMIRTHFDLAPVALTLAALLLICVRRTTAGFAVLAVAVMTKGFPVVVAPVALAWLVARGARREAWSGAVAFVLTGAAIAAVAVALSPSGSLDAITYHLDRPVQLESTAASLLLALDGLGAGTAESIHSHRSDGLVHPAGDTLTALLALALIGAVTLCAVAAARDREGASGRTLVLASLAATTAFAVLGKVLSPQFLIWVVPLAALAAAWRMWPLAAACAAAIALTLVEFPIHYDDVVARDGAWLWLVAVRNAVLAAAVVLAVRAALSPARTTGSAAARSRSPGRRHRSRPAPR